MCVGAGVGVDDNPDSTVVQAAMTPASSAGSAKKGQTLTGFPTTGPLSPLSTAFTMAGPRVVKKARLLPDVEDVEEHRARVGQHDPYPPSQVVASRHLGPHDPGVNVRDQVIEAGSDQGRYPKEQRGESRP